jgi:hypothetical protein
MKDRHTGAGREGSGRVSVYRATGVTYCYTLECNFNTGRVLIRNLSSRVRVTKFRMFLED